LPVHAPRRAHSPSWYFVKGRRISFEGIASGNVEGVWLYDKYTPEVCGHDRWGVQIEGIRVKRDCGDLKLFRTGGERLPVV
jgi:hypothetical protein